MFNLEEYKSLLMHYPSLARRIEKHLNMYPDCSCELWAPPLESSPFGIKTVTCCNCQISVQNSGFIRDCDLQKELYLYEYSAAVLNTNADTQNLDLCMCCYEDFKKEFDREFCSTSS